MFPQIFRCPSATWTDDDYNADSVSFFFSRLYGEVRISWKSHFSYFTFRNPWTKLRNNSTNSMDTFFISFFILPKIIFWRKINLFYSNLSLTNLSVFFSGSSSKDNLSVADYREMVKTLVCGVKTITWGAGSCKLSGGNFCLFHCIICVVLLFFYLFLKQNINAHQRITIVRYFIIGILAAINNLISNFKLKIISWFSKLAVVCVKVYQLLLFI